MVQFSTSGGEEAGTPTAGKALLHSAAADEVDDFQLISFVECGLGPAIARNNVAIQFYGHAVGLHAESFHKRGEGKGRRSVGEVALFPIDLKFHFTEARVNADGTSRRENSRTHASCSSVSGTDKPRAPLICASASPGVLPSRMSSAAAIMPDRPMP